MKSNEIQLAFMHCLFALRILEKHQEEEMGMLETLA
jgi:hypothetical protein